MVDGRRRLGDTWSEDTHSYGSYPLRTTATVVSDSETVEAPAGIYTNCRLLRMITEDPAPDRDEGERVQRLNMSRLGTREVWYAPGVGLVKIRVATQETKDDPPVFVLREASLSEGSDGWLPLVIGNRWVYVLESMLGKEFHGAHMLQVRYRDEQDRFCLSHSQWGYPTGEAAEREAKAVRAEAEASAVRNTSNWPTATRNRSPFSRPDQPCSVTVQTVCPASSPTSLLGRDSSSRMRIGV